MAHCKAKSPEHLKNGETFLRHPLNSKLHEYVFFSIYINITVCTCFFFVADFEKSRVTFLQESHYCFANISVPEAWIFRKFYVVVHYYLVSLSFKFHEDSDSNARARVVNARTRDKMCARAFTTL